MESRYAPGSGSDGADMVHACPHCGELTGIRARICECDSEVFSVEMPAVVAERLRELTERVIRSCTLGDTSVRLYRHAGLQIGGYDTKGILSFSRADADALAAVIRGDDALEKDER